MIHERMKQLSQKYSGFIKLQNMEYTLQIVSEIFI